MKVTQVSSRPSTSRPESLGRQVRRDLEVSRFDHVVPGEAWLAASAEEAARIAASPAAAINLMRSTTQHTVAAFGAPVGVVARSVSMCDAVVDGGVPVHVEDASQDERWAGNPYVDGRHGRIRFYGAHPLVTPSGYAVGTLCVFDDRPRRLDADQVAELDALATRVVAGLEQGRTAALEHGVRRFTEAAARV